MRLIDETKSVIGQLIDIGIALLALGILLSLLAGGAVPFLGAFIVHLVRLVELLGGYGLVGLIVLVVILRLFASGQDGLLVLRARRISGEGPKADAWLGSYSRYRPRRPNWLTTLMILGASLSIAVIGFASGEDLNALLGQWRTGVVLLAGTALLFLHAVWLQSLLRFRSDVEDVADRQAANRELLSDIGRRLGPRRASKRG